jgi:hypothetical protein
MLLLLKCASFALGALQLRSGYPPPASYRYAAAIIAASIVLSV